MGIAGDEFSGTAAPSKLETIIRLFVSSTFRDFRIERDALQTHVYPRLRRYCARHGLRFQAIDLRWGVSPEASLDQQTMNLCLDELRRCQVATPRPNFLVLVGDLYGWRPLPPQIPADEFQEILQVLLPHERQQLCWTPDSVADNGWYRLDHNAVPPEYGLRSRSDLESAGGSATPLHPETGRKTWEQIEQELSSTLRAALERLGWPATDLRRRRYEDSATHQEIRHGALNVIDAEHHVLCCLRRFSEPPQPHDPQAQDFMDLLPSSPDAASDPQPNFSTATRMAELKSDLRDRFSPTGNIHNYEIAHHRALDHSHAQTVPSPEPPIQRADVLDRLDPDTAKSIRGLCLAVYRHLRGVVRRELDRRDSVRRADWSLDHENVAHQEFGDERAACFVGRDDLLDEIEIYLRGNQTTPLVFIGPGGCGKTALLARAAQRAIAEQPPATVRHVITRYIGATSISSDWRQLLEDLCRQIYRVCRLDDQLQRRLAEVAEDDTSAAGSDQRLKIRSQYRIEGDAPALQLKLNFFLQQVPPAEQLVIVLDALDQFTDGGAAATGLPSVLPANVKLVLSALASTGLQPDSLCSLLRGRWPHNVILMSGLDIAEGNLLLDRWLEGSEAGAQSGTIRKIGTFRQRRTLQPAQRHDILTKFSTTGQGLPLYLRLAYEAARHWKSYVNLPLVDGDETTLSATLDGLLEQLFERLEDPRQHGPVLTRRTLAFLAAARHGLTEDELLDLLSSDPDLMREFVERSPTERAKAESERLTTLPTLLWSRLYADLEPYLKLRSADGTVLLSFYHRVVGESVTRRYLADTARLRTHAHMARYFDGHDWWLGSLDEQRKCVLARPAQLRRTNQRCLAELPWQLLRTAVLARDSGDDERARGAWRQLETLFTTLDFLEAGAESGTLNQLAADLNSAALAADLGTSYKRTLELLDNALRADLAFLIQSPTCLFQSLWNRCWWFDSPEAASHFDAPEGGWSVQAAPWNRDDVPRLYRIAEDWQAEKTRNFPGFRWLRSLFPPLKCLESPEVVGFECGIPDVAAIAISPDQSVLATAGQGTVALFQLTTGTQIRTLRATDIKLQAVAFSADGREVIGAASNGQIYFWSVDDEAVRQTTILQSFTSGDLVLARNGETVAALPAKSATGNARPSEVAIWNTRSGTRQSALPEIGGKLETVAVSGNGSCVAIGSEAGEIIVCRQDAAAGMDSWCIDGRIPVSQHPIQDIALDETGQHFAIEDQQTQVYVMDQSGRLLLQLPAGSLTFRGALAISDDGKWLVTGAAPRLTYWSIEQGVAVRSFEATEGSRYPLQAIIARDQTYVAALYEGEWIHVWDIHSPHRQPIRRGHQPGWASGMVHCIELSGDASRFISLADDQALFVWDTTTGRPLMHLVLDQMAASPLSISHRGSRVAWAPNSDEVRVTNVEGQQEVVTVSCSHPNLLALSPNGERLAAGSYNVIQVWQLPEREPIARLEGGQRTLTALAIAPDGRYLVSAYDDDTVRLWDVVQQRQIGMLKLDWMDSIYHLGFSQDGAQIQGISSFYNLQRVWDVATGRCLSRMTIPTRTISADRGSGDLCLGAAISARGLEILAEDGETTLAALPYWNSLANIHCDPRTIARTTFRTDGRIWGLTDYQSIGLYRLEGDVQTRFTDAELRQARSGLHWKGELAHFTLDGVQPPTEWELREQQQAELIRQRMREYDEREANRQEEYLRLAKQRWMESEQQRRAARSSGTISFHTWAVVTLTWCAIVALAVWMTSGWRWGWLLWGPLGLYGSLVVLKLTLPMLGWVKVKLCPECGAGILLIPPLELTFYTCEHSPDGTKPGTP